MEDVPTLVEILTLMTTGVVAGPVLSFLFENLAFFQNLTPSAKRLVIVVTTIGMPVVAGVVLQFVPAETLAALEPYWHWLAVGFVSLLASQVYHKFVNKGGRV